MRDFILAVKLYMKGFLNLNVAKYSKDPKEKSRARSTVTAIIVSSCIMTFTYGFSGIIIGRENASLPMLFALAMSFIMTIASGIGAGTSDMLLFKDHDMLMSMPLKKSSIVASRVFIMYISNLVYLMMFLPGAVIACTLSYGFSFGLLLRLLLLSLFIPAVPTAISTMLGIILTYISSRFNAKSVFQTIVSLLFPIILMFFIFSSQNDATGGAFTAFSGLTDAMLNIYPPAVWLSKAVHGDIISLLLFVLLGILALGVTLLLMTLLFSSLREKLMRTGKSSRNKGILKLGSSGAMAALITRELKKYFSMPVYVSNTIIGPVLLLVMSIAVVIFGTTISEALSQVPIFIDVIPLAGIFINYITGITTCSISSEASTIWQLKTLPLPARYIVNSKVLLHILLCAPANVLGAVLIPIGLNLNILTYTPLLLLLYVGSSVVAACFGLILDMRRPRFDWKSEQEIVKQGGSVMIFTLVAMLISFSAIPACIVLSIFSSSTISLAVVDGITLIVGAMLYRHILITANKKMLSM